MTIERAASQANDTLNETSATLVTGLTLTPAADDYFLFALVQMETPSSAGSSENFFSVFVGGSIVDHSVRQYDEDTSVDNCFLTYMLSCKVSPNGGQAVEIRHRAASGSSPQVAQGRELNLFPISGTDVEVSATGNATLSTGTWTALLTATTPAAGAYACAFSTSGEGPSANELGFRITVGGTVVPHSVRQEEQESSGASDHFSIGLVAEVNPDGTEDVVIEWSRIQGSGTIQVDERTLNLIPTAGADIFEASSVADDADSTTTDKLVDGMTITDPGADDYLVMFTAFNFFPSISNNQAEVSWSIETGGTKVTDITRIKEHEGSLDNVNMMHFGGGRVTHGAGDDLTTFWQGSSSMRTRTCHERTMVALREAVAAPALDHFLFSKTRTRRIAA